jgi:hypothetical protein
MARRGRVRALTGIVRQRGAWSVRLVRAGRSVTRWFADAVWGGRGPAKVAAQRFRDGVLLRMEPDTRFRRRELKKSRYRRTGVVGVTLELHVSGGRVYERYVAVWPDGHGGTKRRRFLVQCYGAEEARRLAIDARRSGLIATRRVALVRQREEAAARLARAPAAPSRVKDPRDRKGISMARRRMGSAQRGATPARAQLAPGRVGRRSCRPK